MFIPDVIYANPGQAGMMEIWDPGGDRRV
jgi:hypothetical protein